MQKESLKSKTVKGVGWSAADNFIQIGINFIVSIILARLLSPEHYGLIGIIAIFTEVGYALINSGFTSALIRKKDATESDYNTAFFVNLTMSCTLYALLFISAPLIAGFFHRDELIGLVRVTSLSLVVISLAFVQQTRLTKRIDFKSQTRVTFIAYISGGVLGIILALLGCGVWALVAQQLSSQIIRVIALYYVNRWFPKFTFSKSSFKELFGFGWKIMLSGLIDTVWKELYQVIVGRFYSPGTLGQYTRAKQFSHLFSSNLTKTLQRVTYPVLSNIQNDKERLKNGYRKIIRMTMFVTSICMISLAAVSEPLIYCLIGPKWHEASTYLPFICIIGSLYPLQSINLNMLQVQGRSDLFLGLEIIKKIVSLGPLFVGAFVGILPMLYASMCTSLIALYLNSYYSGKFLNYSIGQQLRDIIPFYLVSFSIAIPVWFLKYLSISNWIILPLQLSVIFSTFVVLCKIFKIKEYEEVLSFITPIIRRFKP